MVRQRDALVISLLAALSFTVPSSAAASATNTHGDTATSTAIAAEIRSSLAADPLLKSDAVTVKMYRSVATLGGTTRNLIDKHRAAALARSVTGVIAVVNKIDVKPRVHLSAEDIENSVRDALLANRATESFQISVDAGPNGAVQLTGQVDSWGERQLAGYVAKSVAGITELHNDLEVDYLPRRPDSEIASEIKGLLKWDAEIEDSTIDVSVRDGIAQLSGTVESAADKDRAMTIAWSAGSKQVDAHALDVVHALDVPGASPAS
jgi:osmotically-inducible protein OsmY